MRTRNTSLLVISCDTYRDLWRPFFTVFHRHWPDCPYSIFLGTNHATFADKRVSTIRVGDDRSWADGARLMLDAIPSDYVITFLEDFFIKQRVNSEKIDQLVAIAQAQDLGCLRLAAGQPLAFPPTRPVDAHPGLGIVDPGEPYRVSAQVAIWDRATLERLIVPGASPWEFEVIGSALSSSEPKPFWAVYEPAIVYDQVVEKGRWKAEGLRLAEEAGAEVDLTAREIFTETELAEHFARAAAAAHSYHEKTAVLREFRAGRRLAGIRRAADALRKYPGYLTLWIAAIAGLVGPSFLNRVETFNARLRARAVTRRSSRRSRR